MDVGGVLVLLGVILAIVSLFDARYPLLALAVILVGLGVLVGATPLDLKG